MFGSAARTAAFLSAIAVMASGTAHAESAKPWYDLEVFHAMSAAASVRHYIQLSTADDDLLLEDELLTDEDDLLLEEDPDDELLTDDDDLLLYDGSDDELLTDDELLLEDDSDEELLTDDDDLLDSDELDGEGDTKEASDDGGNATSEKIHSDLFIEENYPSANTCATCHPKQYDEWSVSQHAYSQLSPIYMAMQRTINNITSTTNGDFCIRCHNQIGMNLNESMNISNLERPSASREGITCIVCHRVPNSYGKVTGRFPVQSGDLFQPVYGPEGNEELERVLSLPQEYRVVTDKEQPGRQIHTEAKKFFGLTTSGFCATCHDVTLLNGFRLEEAFAEYKRSPAARNGVSCQDCHMGKEQGVNAGYEEGPAAMVGGVPTSTRRLTNHFFAGPDYSVVHPGIFPHNVRAAEFKTLGEWLQFDHLAGWGTDAFEDTVADDHVFPDTWDSVDDRYDARDIIDEQIERLAWAEERRLEVLRNGFKLGDVEVLEASRDDGIAFDIKVMNGTDGHGVPTGFDAERLLYLEVTVTDPAGDVVYQSGDRDPNGDVRDAHSLFVHNGDLPLDEDLFNLQSKFIVRLARGGEREQVLAINTSIAAQPFVRPERRATTIYGRPRGARKHKQTIEPLGTRTAEYEVDEDLLTTDGEYRIGVRMISQMVPVNLLAAIQGVGFDYGTSPAEIGRRIVDGASVLWERETIVTIGTNTEATHLESSGIVVGENNRQNSTTLIE